MNTPRDTSHDFTGLAELALTTSDGNLPGTEPGTSPLVLNVAYG